MPDPAALNNENFDNMTAIEFEDRLPDLIATGHGKLTEDARFATFFGKNPDCAALVRDLESIAMAARRLLRPDEDFETEETDDAVKPGDTMWASIASKLGAEPEPIADGADEILE
jgi:hypothetical protein